MQRSGEAAGGKLLPIDMLLAGAVLLAYLAAFWPVWRSLLAAWQHSEDYSHGFFIVPIALFVLWRKRERLRRVPVRPGPLRLAPRHRLPGALPGGLSGRYLPP